ncbi:MAG: flavin-dependent oxidoreductase [Pseudomonadales bacterium]|nr:flavin-dependent oxidoreductase [Pseudomonadales bacterium]
MIIIAGGGIAGLSMALTCHQLGLQCRVYESAEALRPLGVGINLQPNAVRELYELGLADTLAEIGIEAEEWALFTKDAQLVWSEPRGALAGYRWPQFSVHRGQLQMALYREVVKRLGPECIKTDARLVSYQNDGERIIACFARSSGQTFTSSGDLLVGADGIHSAVRAQMHPNEGAPQWRGTIMWRGTTQARAPRTNNSFILIGTLDHRFVCYPITKPDAGGLTTLNWIAEITPEKRLEPASSDWNREVAKEEFLPHFLDWQFPWIDVPNIISGAQTVYEYPLVDRDPAPNWVDGRALLIGDAAHAMYPVGSNGASQAIVDTRLLGAQLQRHGETQAAVQQFQDDVIEDLNALVLRNRGNGPISILGVVEERRQSPDQAIHDIISQQEVAAHMANYKQAAGFAKDALNAAPSILGEQTIL